MPRMRTMRASHPLPTPQRAAPARVRTTLDFAALHDHRRLPARFFGRLVAAGAADLPAA
jgi:hypothetical protein